MLKTLLTATAVSALTLSTAFAQTTPAPAPAAPAAQPSSNGASKAHFISSQSADQWVASKFKGTDVLGPNNEKVGDVTDMLFDKSGKILAYIVGVGGFLGIGQKDVALDPSAFQMVPASTVSAAGTTGTTGTATTAAADSPSNMKLKIAMTKDELKNAPAFEYYKAPARTTSAPGPANTGAVRPAPANPPATKQ